MPEVAREFPARGVVVGRLIVQRTDRLPSGGGIARGLSGGIGRGDPCDLDDIEAEASIVTLPAAVIGAGRAVVEGAVAVVPPESEPSKVVKCAQGYRSVRIRRVAADPTVGVSVETVIEIGCNVILNPQLRTKVAEVNTVVPAAVTRFAGTGAGLAGLNPSPSFPSHTTVKPETNRRPWWHGAKPG